jgi:hypothetical protein
MYLFFISCVVNLWPTICSVWHEYIFDNVSAYIMKNSYVVPETSTLLLSPAFDSTFHCRKLQLNEGH